MPTSCRRTASNASRLDAQADLRTLRRIAEQGDFLVEAGDASALQVLTGIGARVVLGPHINVYRADREERYRTDGLYGHNGYP